MPGIEIKPGDTNHSYLSRRSDSSFSERHVSNDTEQRFRTLMKKKPDSREDNNNGLLGLPAQVWMQLLTPLIGENAANAALKHRTVTRALTNHFIQAAQAAMCTLNQTALPAPPTDKIVTPQGPFRVCITAGQFSGVEIVVEAAADQRKSKDKKNVRMTIHTLNDKQRQIFESVQRKYQSSNYQLDIQIDPH